MVELANRARVLSVPEAARLLTAAGFPAGELVTGVAVGIAESGLRTNARNVNRNGSTDTGWLQINSVHGIPAQQLLDPAACAAAAYRIWSNSGWTAWAAYSGPDFKGSDGPWRTHKARVERELGAGGSGPQFAIGPEDVPFVGPLVEGAGTAVDILTGDVGKAIADVFQLDELFAQLLSVGMALVFSTAALGLIALGFFRLTGQNAGDAFKAASSVAGGAGAVKALV